LLFLLFGKFDEWNGGVSYSFGSRVLSLIYSLLGNYPAEELAESLKEGILSAVGDERKPIPALVPSLQQIIVGEQIVKVALLEPFDRMRK
jgi:hypothetical protein